MLTGISTACLYPLETEKALGRLLGLGVRHFEIFANCHGELEEEFIAKLREMLDAGGAQADSLHLFTGGFEPFMFFSDYRRRFEEGLAVLRRYCRAAHRLGARIVVFHGDHKGSPMSIEQYCERFSCLAAAARQEGVTLAQENVSRCKSASVHNIRLMRRLLGDDIRFVLDLKQALRAGEDPLEMADAMAGGIVGVHLSDHDDRRDCLLPGQGKTDLPALKRKLQVCGYSGPVIIEVYSSCFDSLLQMREAYEYLLSV